MKITFGSLLRLQVLKLWRTGYFREGWGIKLLMGFLILYFFFAFLMLGLIIPQLLDETFGPRGWSLSYAFSAFMLPYFLADLAVRFFLQKLDTLDIRHYLLTPVSRSRLIHLLLTRSLFSIFNLFPLLLLVPFLFRAAGTDWSGVEAAVAALNLAGYVLLGHLLALWLKRSDTLHPAFFWGMAVVVLGYFSLFILGWIDGMAWSAAVFGLAMTSPVTGLWLPALAAVLYVLNFRLLRRKAYEESLNPQRESEAREWDLGGLEKRGNAGLLLAQELRLIWRHKRTRSVALLTFLFVFYGLIFYTNEEYNGMWMMYLFVGIFTTGIFTINYGQFLMSWESSYMDGLMSRPLRLYDYLDAKFYLLAASSVVTYVLTLPMAWFGWEVFAANTAAFFFNLGFNSLCLVYAATYSKKRIELNKSTFFNYQGTSAVQFVIILPIMVFPVIIFLPFWAFQLPLWGFTAVGLAGLISLLLKPVWLKAAEQNFLEKKYRNLEGFRTRN